MFLRGVRLRRVTARDVALIAATLAAFSLFQAVVSAQALPTIVGFPWDWNITVQPRQGSTFGEPIPIALWGDAFVAMAAPERVGGSPSAPPTFDVGPGGFGTNFPSNEPPPMGGIYEIRTEILQMTLTSMMPVQFPGALIPTDVIIRQDPTRPSVGMIQNLQNLGDGTIMADSFFDVFVEIDLPQLGMVLRNDQPMRAGMSFGTPNPIPDFGPPSGPVPELDVPWLPTWLWREFFVNENAPRWIDQFGVPWDRWISIHGHVTIPEPASCTLAAMGAFIGFMTLTNRRFRS